MNDYKRPTEEAIEAALSAYEAQKTTGKLSEDTRTLTDLIWQNERLRKFHISPNAILCPKGSDPNDWQKLLAKENAGLLFVRVLMACDMFFWVGWHARGAVEDADALRKIAGDSPPL